MRRCLVLSLLLVGCNALTSGGEDSDATDQQGVALALDPPALDVTVDEDGAPLERAFRLTSPDYGDVTARAEWSFTSPALGTIEGGVLRIGGVLPQGGQGLVVARFRGGQGSALVRVKLRARPVLDDSAPKDAPSAFEGLPGGGPRPAVAYPLSGAMLPRNLGGMNVQWRGAKEQAAYRLSVEGPTYQQDFYVGAARCERRGAEARCQYPIADRLWLRVAASAAGADLALRVAGSGAGAVGTSADTALSFSPEDVRGGLYYFSTSQWGLLRLPFGGQKAVPFIIGDRLSQTGSCIGCHASTRDGKRVAAVFGGGDGYGGIVDGTDPNTLLRPPRAIKDGRGDFSPRRAGQVWNFVTYSPTGDRLIGVWAGRMELRDGATGELIAQVPQDLLGGLATMPEWSPDGKSIVFVRVSPPGKIGKDLAPIIDFGELVAGDWLLVNAGDLALLPYNDGKFGPAQTVLAAQPGREYHFYPSFSPDGRYLVFNSARQGACGSDTAELQGVEIGAGNCASYDQRNARLRLIEARPGAAPVELARATVAPDKTTAWPRFSPFLQVGQGGRLSFITFSAKLDYGLAFEQPQAPADRRPQLWMAAVDLSRAAAGQDPSYAPFWLPFQDLAERNHQAQWTYDLVCKREGDCGPGFDCQAGLCVSRLE